MLHLLLRPSLTLPAGILQSACRIFMEFQYRGIFCNRSQPVNYFLLLHLCHPLWHYLLSCVCLVSFFNFTFEKQTSFSYSEHEITKAEVPVSSSILTVFPATQGISQMAHLSLSFTCYVPKLATLPLRSVSLLPLSVTYILLLLSESYFDPFLICGCVKTCN